jgi:hypothetical protein
MGPPTQLKSAAGNAFLLFVVGFFKFGWGMKAHGWREWLKELERREMGEE